MIDQNSQFYAILTNIGAAKQANADALGIPWKITQMAIGDGNPGGVENPPLPMPSASATALLNEWRRAPLNQLKVDEVNNAVIVAEQIIPADVGGHWIREIALYDADGDMVAVANCPATYKPLLNQGSGRTQVVRMNLIVSSSSNVELKIDPSVVLATREWVTSELAKQDFKHSVLVATTAAISLSGLQTVDGVALTSGARVLVKDQAAAKDNGLYQVVAGGPWVRSADADNSAKVTPGLLVMVERGTINGDSAWQLVTNAPITVGVTALAFEMAFGRTGVTEGTYRSVTVDKYGHVIAATNPTTVAGYGLTDVYTKNEIDTVLALKAPLASPVFTGVPKAPTPAQFDASELIATMKAVQRALGNASDFEELEADRVITAADAGKTFMLAAPSVVITFPDSTTLPKGFEVTVLSAGGTSGTLAGSTFVSSRGSSITGIEGFSLRLHARKSTNQYRVSHWGDGASSLAGAGYQRFASGLIIQWGLANSSASGTDTTFPIAFPRAVLRVVATPVNYAVPISVVSSNTKITVTAASSTPGCNYLAVGY
ncbi:phage tail protein [Pseudomonas putida]|uniref:phage tail protein n=1 Tax=Pseudomonas putida TaxID=303 RepID=UPI00301C3FF3